MKKKEKTKANQNRSSFFNSKMGTDHIWEFSEKSASFLKQLCEKFARRRPKQDVLSADRSIQIRAWSTDIQRKKERKKESE